MFRFFYAIMITVIMSHTALASNLLQCNKLMCVGCFIGTHDIYVFPSSSMFPTIKKDDCITTKLIDGFEVKRGDVISFKFKDTIYLKRLMAVPGDTIQIISGSVYVNGQKLETRILGEVSTDGGLKYKTEEKNHDGISYFIVNPQITNHMNSVLFTVPEAHVFVMGDNRDNSNDSRYGLGFIPIKDILGILDEIK